MVIICPQDYYSMKGNLSFALILIAGLIISSALSAQNVLDNKVYRVTAYKSGSPNITSTSNYAEVIPLLSIFIPDAFTPNGDGLNDVVRPIAVGIQKINYFSIFNRWGQLVFKTTVNGYGWDGRIKGLVQGTNVFVWMVSAIDYTGKSLFLKGTVTLIR